MSAVNKYSNAAMIRGIAAEIMTSVPFLDIDILVFCWYLTSVAYTQSKIRFFFIANNGGCLFRTVR
jgi:hypothetical protein